jgi:lactoylglutathione lyase
MMNILGIDHVGTRVVDVDRTIRFYENLGFAVIRRDVSEQVFVVKHPSGLELNFLNNATEGVSKDNVLMDVPIKHTGHTHYALAISSVSDAIEFFKRHDITITEGPVTFGDGKASVFVRDPDGNVIELTELPK